MQGRQLRVRSCHHHKRSRHEVACGGLERGRGEYHPQDMVGNWLGLCWLRIYQQDSPHIDQVDPTPAGMAQGNRVVEMKDKDWQDGAPTLRLKSSAAKLASPSMVMRVPPIVGAVGSGRANRETCET